MIRFLVLLAVGLFILFTVETIHIVVTGEVSDTSSWFAGYVVCRLVCLIWDRWGR